MKASAPVLLRTAWKPVAGLSLALAGALVSSSWLAAALRPDVPPSGRLFEEIVMGAGILRACLVVLGLLLAAFDRIPLFNRSGNTSKPAEPMSVGERWLLGAVLAAALVLRLYDLNQGLWLDEVITYVEYVKSMPLGQMFSTYTSENQHFLFNLAARTMVLIFGDTVWAFRLPAALFGVASIGALFLFGRRVATTREALLAAALATFSYHHIWFSQNARGYTALLFWALLSSWLLLRAIERNGTRDWLYFALAVALGVYSHTTMLFMVAGQLIVYGLAALRLDRPLSERWMGFFTGFCLAGFFTILLHAPALPQVFAGMGETSTVGAWKNPLWTLREIAAGVQVGFLGAFAVLPALLVFGVGIWSYLRSSSASVVHLLFWPIAICASLVITIGHHLWPRFFFYAVGFILLVAIRGIFEITGVAGRFFRLQRPNQVRLATWASLAAIALSAGTVPFVYGPKQDYRSALDYVESNRAAGDRVVVAGLAAYTYQNLYRTDWKKVETIAQLNEARSRTGRTWLVYSFPPHLEAVAPDVVEAARHKFTLLRQYRGTLNNGTIYVLRTDALTTASLLTR